ncbi:MAG: glycosyltransferase [Terracidiphilus sp.]|jgi:glycosyltransferase involved in cell wall biosynthesis
MGGINQSSNRVLLINYTFAPALEPGAIRTTKLAKYLPANGFEPIVLTCSNAMVFTVGLEDAIAGLQMIRISDPDPLKRLAAGKPNAQTGLRSRASEPRAWWRLKEIYSQIAFPDRDFLWGVRAGIVASRAIRKSGIKAIYSTAPNMSNHLAALIAHRRTGIPWIAEFRDLWLHPAYSKRSAIRRRLDPMFERLIATSASQVVTISNEHRANLLQAHPNLGPEKVHVITNGFDAEDQAALPAFQLRHDFTISHAGSLYGGLRDPRPLLKAIAQLVSRPEVVRSNVRLNIIGKREEFLADLVREFRLEDVVVQKGQMPYRQTLRTLAESYLVLILTNPSYPELPSKFFDYLCARRPILALCPAQSELAARLASTNAGVSAPVNDPYRIEEELMHYYQLWLSGNSAYECDAAEVRGYHRSEIAARAAAVIHKALNHESPAVALATEGITHA